MTYVTDQSPAELRAHMRSLKRIPGWSDPLCDRLWREIQDLDKANDQLREQVSQLMRLGND